MPRFAHCLMALLMMSSPLLAHPGHGVTEGTSAVHYFIEPAHIGPVLLLLIGSIVAGVLVKRRRKLQREHVRPR
ncbi:MAG TPA: hypothetical protein VM510_12940 [Caulifigura sp.]|nr:hypothetical protein [Caulifigura sp.]